MRVSVFGLGYVGSVTAACLAELGHDVTGVDVSADKVAVINQGRSPVVEPGLAELIGAGVAAGRLRAVSSSEEAVRRSDIALVCVGTPGRDNGALDVSALRGVGEGLGHALRERRSPFTVVVRSTALPGTTESVVVPALGLGAGGVQVAVNPEFLREGSAIEDFRKPPVTLVGAEERGAAMPVAALYEGVAAPVLHTGLRAAEMAKYVANAFHALKICFANEVGDLCAAMGADASEVMRVFLADRKLNLSDAYLRPGFAFGGSCLPKDLRALLYGARSADLFPPLLSAVLPSNDAQVRRAVDAVLSTRKRRVGIVGLAFKDRTDDLRESPMVGLAETLIGKGCDIRILDRNVALSRLVGANRRYIEEQIPHVARLMCEGASELLAHAEVLVVGNAGRDAAEVLAGRGAQHTVVDLTRGRARMKARPRAAA